LTPFFPEKTPWFGGLWMGDLQTKKGKVCSGFFKPVNEAILQMVLCG